MQNRIHTIGAQCVLGAVVLLAVACRRDPPATLTTDAGTAAAAASSLGLAAPSAAPSAAASAQPRPERVVAIAAGADNSFALLASGAVKAWGANQYESLGLGKEKPVVTPTLVPGLTDVKQVATASMHSCAVLRDATARCWGRNFGGALGDGQGKDYTASQPTPVVDLAKVEEVRVGGNHACARTSDGVGSCWGMIISGIGARPLPVPKLAKIAGLAVGGDSSCAWHPDATASCWDLAIGLPFNYGDAVNDGDGNIKPVTAVKGLAGVRELALSSGHACAVTEDARLWCWGSGKRGQLGDGKFGGEPHPVGTTFVDGYAALKPQAVPELADVRAVALAAESTCAVVGSGEVRCWGANDLGQLGVGDRKQRSKPTPVPGLVDVVQLAAGEAHFCALDRDGAVHCWGKGIQGQLGNGAKGVRAVEARPVRVLP